jgi:hypothetical protein
MSAANSDIKLVTENRPAPRPRHLLVDSKVERMIERGCRSGCHRDADPRDPDPPRLHL